MISRRRGWTSCLSGGRRLSWTTSCPARARRRASSKHARGPGRFQNLSALGLHHRLRIRRYPASCLSWLAERCRCWGPSPQNACLDNPAAAL